MVSSPTATKWWCQCTKTIE